MSNTATDIDLTLNESLAVVKARATPQAWREARARTRESLTALSHTMHPTKYGMRPGVVGELPETRRRNGIPKLLNLRERTRLRTEGALMVKHLLEIEAEQDVG